MLGDTGIYAKRHSIARYIITREAIKVKGAKFLQFIYNRREKRGRIAKTSTLVYTKNFATNTKKNGYVIFIYPKSL